MPSFSYHSPYQILLSDGKPPATVSGSVSGSIPDTPYHSPYQILLNDGKRPTTVSGSIPDTPYHSPYQILLNDGKRPITVSGSVSGSIPDTPYHSPYQILLNDGKRPTTVSGSIPDTPYHSPYQILLSGGIEPATAFIPLPSQRNIFQPLYLLHVRRSVPISRPEVWEVEPYSARLRWHRAYIPQYYSTKPHRYRIEMQEADNTPGRDWKPVATGLDETEYTVNDISPRKDYNFRIRAELENGDVSEPTPPIQYHHTKFPMKKREPLNLKATEYKPLELDSTSMNRPYIDYLTKYVPPRLPLDKPDMIVINLESIELSWKPAREPESIQNCSNLRYSIEIRNPPSFEWREVVTGLKCRSYIFQDLNPHIDYIFRIRAWNEYGCSEPCLPISLYRPKSYFDEDYDEDWEDEFEAKFGRQEDMEPPIEEVPPKMPMDTPEIVTQTPDSIWFEWQPARIPAYATKTPFTYVIEIKEPPSTNWRRDVTGLVETRYFREGLSPSQDYHIRVRAESEFGISEPTLPIIIQRSRGSRPGSRLSSMEREDTSLKTPSYMENLTAGVPPRMSSSRPVSTNSRPDGLTLSWSACRVPTYVKLSNATYIIEKREPPGHIWSVFVKDIKETKYNITGLSADQDYMFRVRARNEYGTSDPSLPLTIYRERDDYVPQRIRSRSGSRDSIQVYRSSHKRRSVSIDYGSVKSEEDDLDTGLQTPTQPEYVATTYDTQYGVEGKKGKVTLKVKAYPLPTVHWYFNEEKLQYGDKYNTFITPQGAITLEIMNVGTDSVGEYKCYAENASGAAVKVVTFLLAEPPTVLEPLHDKLQEAYHDVQLKCRVDVTLDPTVKWMKDWRPLADSYRIKTVHTQSDTYLLEIENAVPSDSGVYACLIENMAGKVTLTSRLTVEEASRQTFEEDLPAIPEVNLRSAHIEEHYHILEEIGRGQHGVVHRVIEMSTGKPYAANFMYMRNRAQKNFFLSEFEALRSINHMDRVLHLHDAFESDRSLIFVTEILTGPELLQQVIADGNWTEAKVAAVVKQLLTIVQELQSIGILHLDIKPSNIRLCGHENSDIKLINFALARFLHPEEDITHNYGSVGFASPEQIDNDVVNGKTEMWTIGVLAYVLLSGEIPFQGETDTDILKATVAGTWTFGEKDFENISKDGKDFITKLLVKNKKERMSVDDCLAHPWMSTESAAKINTEKLKNFYNTDKLKRETHKLYTTAHLQSLMKVMHGTAALYQPAIDVDSGEIIFPDSDDFGDYLDEDNWIEWQLQYQDDPDSQEFAIRDKKFTVRESKHTAAGSVHKDDKDKEPECDSLMFVNKIQTETFELGDDITFMCSVVSKKDAPVVNWYRDETLLSDAYRAEPSFDEETGVATLSVINAKDYDTGVYKCVAMNKDGRVSCQARLLLGERPGRPGQPVVTQVSGTEAFMTWTGPLCDGNSYILGYRVDYRKQGETTWVHGPCVTEEYALVSGLLPNTGYIFRVTCHNKYGISPYSWASLEAVTLAEDAPKITMTMDLQPLLKFTTFTRQQLILPAESRRPSLSAKEEAKIVEGSPEENFLLGDVLSKGSYGEYKLCSDKSTNQQYVMKIVPYKEEKHDQITREFEMLRHLRQGHIISILDSYVSEDSFYMVFEHLSGMNMLQYLCLRKSYKEDLVARLVAQILDALQYLHHHDIAHCNLQPSSVVMASLRRPYVKLRDFTHAQKIMTSQQKLSMVGYPDFVAPEMIKTEPAGFCPDMWALGTLTFILLSGVSPFAGDSLKDTLSRILFDRYCLSDLYDNTTKDGIKFVSKLLKRLPKNRATIGQCLKSRWLQQTDSMLKAKTNAWFRTERLRDFSKVYLQRRADPEYMDLASITMADLPRPTPGPAFKPILNDKVVNRHVVNIRISKSKSKSASPLKQMKKTSTKDSKLQQDTEMHPDAKLQKETEVEKAGKQVIEEVVVETSKEEPVFVEPISKQETASNDTANVIGTEADQGPTDTVDSVKEAVTEASDQKKDKPAEETTTDQVMEEVIEEVSKSVTAGTEASKSDVVTDKTETAAVDPESKQPVDEVGTKETKEQEQNIPKPDEEAIKTETDIKVEEKEIVEEEQFEEAETGLESTDGSNITKELHDLSKQIVDNVLKEAFEQVKVEKTVMSNQAKQETVVKEEIKSDLASKADTDNVNVVESDDEEFSECVESMQQSTDKLELNEDRAKVTDDQIKDEPKPIHEDKMKTNEKEQLESNKKEAAEVKSKETQVEDIKEKKESTSDQPPADIELSQENVSQVDKSNESSLPSAEEIEEPPKSKGETEQKESVEKHESEMAEKIVPSTVEKKVDEKQEPERLDSKSEKEISDIESKDDTKILPEEKVIESNLVPEKSETNEAVVKPETVQKQESKDLDSKSEKEISDIEQKDENKTLPESAPKETVNESNLVSKTRQTNEAIVKQETVEKQESENLDSKSGKEVSEIEQKDDSETLPESEQEEKVNESKALSETTEKDDAIVKQETAETKETKDSDSKPEKEISETEQKAERETLPKSAPEEIVNESKVVQETEETSEAIVKQETVEKQESENVDSKSEKEISEIDQTDDSKKLPESDLQENVSESKVIPEKSETNEAVVKPETVEKQESENLDSKSEKEISEIEQKDDTKTLPESVSEEKLSESNVISETTPTDEAIVKQEIAEKQESKDLESKSEKEKSETERKDESKTLPESAPEEIVDESNVVPEISDTNEAIVKQETVGKQELENDLESKPENEISEIEQNNDSENQGVQELTESSQVKDETLTNNTETENLSKKDAESGSPSAERVTDIPEVPDQTESEEKPCTSEETTEKVEETTEKVEEPTEKVVEITEKVDEIDSSTTADKVTEEVTETQTEVKEGDQNKNMTEKTIEDEQLDKIESSKENASEKETSGSEIKPEESVKSESVSDIKPEESVKSKTVQDIKPEESVNSETVQDRKPEESVKSETVSEAAESSEKSNASSSEETNTSEDKTLSDKTSETPAEDSEKTNTSESDNEQNAKTVSDKTSEIPAEDSEKSNTSETDNEQNEDEPNEEDIARQMAERAILEDAMIFC